MSSKRFDRGWCRDALARRVRPLVDGDAEPRAAVAIVVREGAADHEVLLIRRAQRAGDPWSGHMAFPGGRRDPADRDPLETAVRETREEVGLDLSAHAELLGRLDDLPSIGRGQRTGVAVTPFVFAASAPLPDLTLNVFEVDEVVWAPLGPLWSGAAATIVPYVHEGRPLELPGWRVGEHVVWGMTHRMLGGLFALLDDHDGAGPAAADHRASGARR